MINIADILRDKPKGTKLYSSAIGGCKLLNVGKDDIIVRDFRGNDYTFNKHGILIDTNGECTLFPSRQMKDWERFSWKTGDVLSCGVDNLCVFDDWANDDYTEFHSKYNSVTFGNENALTLKWIKVDNEKTIQQYISNIEEIKYGKLNLKTLKIEKQEKFQEGDIIQVDNDKFIILKRIESYKIYYHYYYKDGATCINGSLNRANCTLKLASKADQLTILSSLKNIGKKWNPDTKQIENLPKKHKFKPFDKVIVRDSDYEKWRVQIFSHYNIGNDVYCKYGCINNSHTYCIPYEGNEHLLGTTDNYEE